MIIAGIDPSLTSAGIAVLRDGRPVLLTSVGHGTPNGRSHSHRSRRIVSQTRAILSVIATTSTTVSGGGFSHDATPIDLAVIEDQLEHGPMLPSALDRSALWWGIFSALQAKRIPVAVVNPSTLKVWVTGKGNATKPQMLNTMRGWYREPIANHDQADALALATVGAFRLGDPMPFEVKERHSTALEKVEWPVIA